MAEDQHDVIAFLGDPATYGAPSGTVVRLETHISLVFLAGEHAYKLKRAVTFPYLDFSTAEKRRAACEAELRLNRRTAPQLYLETRAISRRPDGTLGWGDGQAVDWVVVMRRFDQDRRLDAIAAAGGLDAGLIRALAAHIAEFHAAAEQRRDFGGAAGLAAIIDENDSCLSESRAVAFSEPRIGELRDLSNEWLRRLTPLLDRRQHDGRVRRCHGDLHLRNICVLDGKPVLFDCIEFADKFACIDVLYDLAFLLMDLEHHGHEASANLLLNRYLDLTDEAGGLAAMPLFMALRAAIRAHVAASAGGGDAATEAQSYLEQACAALKPPKPLLIAIGGLSGTGKSTLAAALAPALGARPGARLLRSDVTRKRLFDRDPETPLPPEAYTAEVTQRVYAALRDRAAAALRSGYSAIVDAVALRPEERRAIAAVATEIGVPFSGLWLDAPTEALSARVTARRGDASDATQAVVEQQLRVDPGPLDWWRIDAGGQPGAALAAAKAMLGLG